LIQKIIYILFIIAISIKAYSQKPVIVWDKTLGCTKDDISKSAVKYFDQGYVITGYSQCDDFKGKDMMVAFVDNEGNEIWKKNYGGKYDDWGNDIIITEDKGFIVVGYSLSNTDIDTKGTSWIVKLNKDGNVEWEKQFGGRFNDELVSIIKTSENNEYVIVGSAININKNNKEIKTTRITKISESGDFIFTSYINSNNEITPTKIIETDEGYSILGIIKETEQLLGTQFYFATINKLGEVTSENLYGYDKDEYAKSFIYLPDEGYFLVGSTSSNTKGKEDALFIKTDLKGKIIWEKTYGGFLYDDINSINYTIDGNYILVGTTESKGAGEKDILVLKIDNNGEVLWTKTLGLKNNEEAFSVLTEENGSYIITGYTNSKGNGANDTWILKLTEPDIKAVEKVINPKKSYDEITLYQNAILSLNGIPDEYPKVKEKAKEYIDSLKFDKDFLFSESNFIEMINTAYQVGIDKAAGDYINIKEAEVGKYNVFREELEIILNNEQTLIISVRTPSEAYRFQIGITEAKIKYQKFIFKEGKIYLSYIEFKLNGIDYKYKLN